MLRAARIAHTVISYNSCRDRHCPKCQAAASREWLAEREAELLPVPYFHVVYTLPAPIADIAYHNKRVIYDLLFKAAADTTITIAEDPKHLGARIGLTAVLHTWGSAMTHHPHVHMIVPGGGLSHDRLRWVSCRPNFVLAVRVLSRLFRRRFLKMLIAAHQGDRLKFFGDHASLAERDAFIAFLHRSRRSSGSFTPRSRSPGQSQSCGTWPATPIASPSPTSGWSPPTMVASPSAGRTIASAPIAG